MARAHIVGCSVVPLLFAFAATPAQAPPEGATTCGTAVETKVPSPDPDVWDFMGRDSALDGDTLAACAPLDDDLGLNSGSVRIFRRNGGAWTLEDELHGSDTGAQDVFGSAVDLEGDTLLVGAATTTSFDTGPYVQSDPAYVFRRSGTSWAQEQTLQPLDQLASDDYGCAVALSGNTAVVGARLDEDPASGLVNTGSAYVWTFDGAAWTLQQKLQAAAPLGTNDRFGSTLAVEGDLIAVGAPEIGFSAGGVYLFERSGTTWTETALLQAGGGGNGHQFGDAVAIGAERVFVGAPGVNRVYAFARVPGGGWVEEQTLLSSLSGLGAIQFGRSVAADGTRLAIGAPFAFTDGVVFLFERNGGVFNEVAWFSDPGLTGGFIGGSVDIDGATLTAGAPNDDEGAVHAGAQYVFDAFPSPTAYCTAKTNSLGCASPIGYTGCPSASQATAFRISATEVRNNVTGLLFYGTSGASETPLQGGLLCVAPTVTRTPGAFSGGSAPPVDDCSGSFVFEFNDWIASGSDPSLSAGQPVWAQFWSRDPGFAPPDNSHLTDGLAFEIGP